MKLSNYLRKNGITREEFAKKLGVSPHTVIKWANETRSPNRLHTAKVRQVTGREVDYDDWPLKIKR